MIIQYIRTALRNIIKNKTFSLINLVGLSLGLISCIYILLWVQDELSYDGFHRNYSKLYRFIAEMDDGKHDSTPLALAPNLKENFPEIIYMTRISKKSYDLNFGLANYNESGALIDLDFFKMLSFPFIKGSFANNFNESNTIVITERLANKLFSKDPIGETLVINSDKKFIITGVLKDVPKNSHIQFDFLIPINKMRNNADTDWSYDCSTYFILNGNIEIDNLEKKITNFVRDNDKTDANISLQVQSFKQIHLYSLNGTDPILYIYFFVGLGFIILLIAIFNFVNLSNSRSNKRSKEVGLRKVVGAVKNDIVIQFIIESIILSMMALILTMLVAPLLFPEINKISGKQLSMDHFLSLFNLIGAIILAFLTGVAAGTYPALLLSSITPAKTVSGKFLSTNGGIFLRRLFVSTQFIVTVVLIIISFTMYNQLDFIQNRNLGLNKNHVMVMHMSDELWSKFSIFKEELKRNTNIINVSSAYNAPTEISHTNVLNWEGNTIGQPVVVNDQSVDYDYFDLFEMKLVDGRTFSRDFTTDDKSFILNEEAVKLIGYNSHLGKTITVWNTKGTIIGVVKNFHSSSIHNEIKPVIFMLSERHGPRTKIFIKIKPDQMNETIEFIKRTVANFTLYYQFNYTFLDKIFANQYLDDQRFGTLYRIFTILAAIISCLGLYGLINTVVDCKMKEIAVRKVLGASVLKLITIISKEFILIISVSILIGWPLAYFIVIRILNNYAYKTPLTVWIFIIAGIIVTILALLSISKKVIDAALVNPASIIRQE